MNPLPLVRFASLEPFPGLLHGLSTRRGGVSSGPFASLNLGWTVGDDEANVETNYRRLAGALGVRRDHLTTTWQVHGNRILAARSADRGQMIDKADGIVTDRPNLPLSQRYADCTPLLAYDPRRHAIGLAHAGWRGTVANVAGALVRAMTDNFGSDPGDLAVVIGPAIGPCCYEVGPEVARAVEDAFPAAGRLLSQPQKGGGRPRLDLWEANRRQLVAAGVVGVQVAGVCTRCRRDRYFSHRGEQGRTGRFAAVMMLRS